MKPLLATMLLMSLCKTGDLRGHDRPTPGGATQLAIDDDNGGGCTLWVDGQKWPHGRAVSAPVTPGRHRIACGDRPSANAFEVDVRAGHTYHFDYWGP